MGERYLMPTEYINAAAAAMGLGVTVYNYYPGLLS